MAGSQLKPPQTKRAFTSVWGELDYLCKKVSYWLYSGMQSVNAERYVDRLEKLLGELPANKSAILREEGLALLHEFHGEFDQAISHREREIQLMERLHREAQSREYDEDTKAFMLQDRDMAALEKRRALLLALKKADSQPHRPMNLTA